MRPPKEATSKENDYSKQCVNYFQSWHMGSTNKLNPNPNSIKEMNTQQQTT